jgi:peptidoglycan hydrolase CwlO-like protein
MQFADDFLEDSESSQEEEDASEDPASFFITGTQADVPALPLQPAIPVVQLLPLIEVTRDVVSRMLSLSLFGNSAIGATIPGTIYDLSTQGKRARDKFLAFFEDNQSFMQTEQYKLGKSYDDLTKRASDVQGWNRRLNSVIRTYEKRISEIQNGCVSLEISQLDSELKAVSGKLKAAIVRLQEAHQENRNLQSENDSFQEKVDKLMKGLRKKGGRLSQRTRSLAKLELELANTVTQYNDRIARMQNSVNTMAPTIEALRAKLADLDRRVAMSQYPLPLRDPAYALIRPTRHLKA